MAIQKCDECGREVSTKAGKCPGCGAPVYSKFVKTMRAVFFACVGFIVFVAVIGVMSEGDKADPSNKQTAASQSESAPSKEPEKEKEKEKEKPCDTDACLVDKYLVSAAVACKPAIQGLAKYDYEWTDGFTKSWASRYIVDREDGVKITYFGDALKLQNGFGAWSHMIYKCVFDTESESVLDVVAEQGQL